MDLGYEDIDIQAFLSSTVGIVTMTTLAVLYILWVVAVWKVFTKAGYWGILSLIPIVNTIILVRISGFSGWLALLYIIPIVGFIFAIIVAVRLGERFGKSGFFSVLWLWLLPFIGYYMIGFGTARYTRA